MNWWNSFIAHGEELEENEMIWKTLSVIFPKNDTAILEKRKPS